MHPFLLLKSWLFEAIRAVKTISKSQMKNLERFKQEIVQCSAREALDQRDQPDTTHTHTHGEKSNTQGYTRNSVLMCLVFFAPFFGACLCLLFLTFVETKIRTP